MTAPLDLPAAALAALRPEETRISTPELLDRLLPAFPDLRAEALGRALTAAGWQPAQWRTGGKRVRGYELPDERRACEIRLRAERRAGQLIAEMEKAKGAREPGTDRGTTRSHDATASGTLASHGISKQQSSDCPAAPANLTAGQRAMVGARAANLPVGRHWDKPEISPDKISQPAAAALVGVHERTVRDAKVVLTVAPLPAPYHRPGAGPGPHPVPPVLPCSVCGGRRWWRSSRRSDGWRCFCAGRPMTAEPIAIVERIAR